MSGVGNKTEMKKYTYYPGCSSQGSASHLDKSLRAIAPEIGIELEELDDWNCCGASVGHVESGYLPNAVFRVATLPWPRSRDRVTS